jgi:hypothetical protein
MKKEGEEEGEKKLGGGGVAERGEGGLALSLSIQKT